MNEISWSQLYPSNPDSVAAGDIDGSVYDDMIIDFGAAYGIWVRNDADNWQELHGLSPEQIVVADIDDSSSCT